MAHNYIATDSPLSRRIVRAFLHFLNSVEPGPGVDAEGIEVARECLAEAFKLNQSPVAGDDVKSDSLIDIFKSLEAKKQCEPSKSDVGPQPDSVDASSSFSVSKDELCGQFFAALEKNCYFWSNTDGSDDPVQLEKASCLFNEACMELERSGCHQFSLKNLAESLKTLGQLLTPRLTNIQKRSKIVLDPLRLIQTTARHIVVWVWFIMHKEITEMLFIKGSEKVAERKLLEEQHRAYQNQNSRSSQEFPNQSAQGGSRSHSVPPPFSSMSFNPRDIASMFMNITNPTNAQPQGSHSHQERQEDSNGSGTSEPEIRIGGNISVNMEDMPEDITGALQSMMEMLSGAAPPGQPQDQTNGRTAPN